MTKLGVHLVALLGITILVAPALAQSDGNQDEPAAPPDLQDTAPTEPDTDPFSEPDTDPFKDDLDSSLSPGASETPQGSTTKEEAEKNEGSDLKQEPEGSDKKSGSDTRQGSDTSNQPPIVDPADADVTPGTVDAAFEKFNALVQERRTNEQKVNQLVINMPIGFPEKRRAQQATIAALRQRNAAILGELAPLAEASFDAFPNTQRNITGYLLSRIQNQLTGKNYRQIPFDPVTALKSYHRMVDAGVENQLLYMFGYRSHYINHEFEDSARALKKAIAMKQQVDPRAFDDLKSIHKGWQRELDLQKQDADNQNPLVKIEMDCGVIVVELFEDQAPNTVANFVTLAQDGFYNGLVFYQANPTEVVLTGSPTNNGQGGPGYQIDSEASRDEIRNHFTGTLSMIVDGTGGAGSKFLITKQPRPNFDGRLTAFGRIVEGLENLYKINVVNLTASLSRNDKTRPTQILKMTVTRKRDHEYAPQKMTVVNPGG